MGAIYKQKNKKNSILNKESLKKIISNGNIEQALSSMDGFVFKRGNNDQINEFSLIKSTYSDWKSSVIKGIVNYDNRSTQHSIIVNNFLEFIDNFFKSIEENKTFVSNQIKYNPNEQFTTIPYLPNSIIAGLSKDVLHYLNEIKYLLLFFEKPVAYMNSSYGFIDEEAIYDIKNDKTPRVSMWEDENEFDNILSIKSEEWDTTLNECEILNQTMDLEITDRPTEWDSRILGVIDFYDLNAELKREDFKDDNEYMMRSIGQWGMKLQLQRLIEVLDKCNKKNIPMIWSTEEDMQTAHMFSRYLIEAYPMENVNRIVRAEIRKIKGYTLLREIFNLGIINLLSVPTYQIVSFRKSHKDLLDNFLTEYRDFLALIQINPKESDKLLEIKSREIVKNLNEINNEIVLKKKSIKNKWIKDISEIGFETAKKSERVASWGQVGNALLHFFTFNSVSDKIDNGINTVNCNLEESLLLRNSSGYLWKIQQEFKK